MTGRYLIPFKKRNSLVPSFLSGGQNRNDDRRKNIIWLLAKNPALVNRNRVVNSCTFCLDSSLYPVLFYYCIPDRIFPSFENDRQVFSTVEKQNPPLPNSHHSRWSGMASNSAPYFFISLFPTAFYDGLRMTGRYLIPFCIKSPFTVLLTLAPSDGFCFATFLYLQTHRGRFFVCVISLFFVFAILIFLFSGVKISVFFLKTGISFIFILLLYQLYCKPKNIFSWHYIFIPV